MNFLEIFFPAKKPPKSVALIDIGSGTVAGALVRYEAGV